MSLFEIGMLTCFGVSWPISILKALHTRQVAGKSPVFMIIVCCGYACGIAHKLLNDRDWVTLLYAVNLFMVACDFALYLRYRPRAARPCPAPAAAGT